MTRANPRKPGKVGRKYIKWRNGLPAGVRILYDIVSVVAILAVLIYGIMWLLPILLLGGIAIFGIGMLLGSARRNDWPTYDEDNDPRGTSGPRGAQ